jgi:hypothetical protein
VSPQKDRTRLVVGVIGIAVLGIWIFVAFLPRLAATCSWFSVSKDDFDRLQKVLPQLGVYGDMFGSINALFSAMALLGIVYAVLLQKDEMHDQRIEARNAEAARKKSHIEQLKGIALQSISVLSQNYAVIATTEQYEVGRIYDPTVADKLTEEMKGQDFAKVFRLMDALPKSQRLDMANTIILTFLANALEGLAEYREKDEPGNAT